MLTNGYSPARRGCTVCDAQDTESLDAYYGRRCCKHPPPVCNCCERDDRHAPDCPMYPYWMKTTGAEIE